MDSGLLPTLIIFEIFAKNKTANTINNSKITCNSEPRVCDYLVCEPLFCNSGIGLGALARSPL
jgi:hypothetical protein